MQAHAHAALQDSLPLADFDEAAHLAAHEAVGREAGSGHPTPAAEHSAATPAATGSAPGAGPAMVTTATGGIPAAENRALTIVGISDDGAHVVCVAAQQPAVSDSAVAAPRYTLAIDERLRAAIRGDLGDAAHGSKGEVEMAPGLRPREIQSRIRAGATVEQVAAAAGCPVDRIEGFAYPVLLERATIAERARAARPQQGRSDSLEEIVTATLVDRGQQQGVEWDAFKDERGWVIALTWQAGRSENRAEWAYAPRPGGGTVTALGSEAADLLAPERSQLRPVDRILGSAKAYADGPDAAPGHASTAHTAAPAEPAGTHPAVSPAGGTGQEPAQGQQDARVPRSSRRGHRPQMPSWEDVLLGTRTAEH